jgi:hypothetical protein
MTDGKLMDDAEAALFLGRKLIGMHEELNGVLPRALAGPAIRPVVSTVITIDDVRFRVTMEQVAGA